jgi:hypothetical protein
LIVCPILFVSFFPIWPTLSLLNPFLRSEKRHCSPLLRHATHSLHFTLTFTLRCPLSELTALANIPAESVTTQNDTTQNDTTQHKPTQNDISISVFEQTPPPANLPLRVGNLSVCHLHCTNRQRHRHWRRHSHSA